MRFTKVEQLICLCRGEIALQTDDYDQFEYKYVVDSVERRVSGLGGPGPRFIVIGFEELRDGITFSTAPGDNDDYPKVP